MTPKTQKNLPNLLLILVLGILLFGEAFFGYQVYKHSAQRKQIKEDYSLANSITFGIFSIDRWEEKIMAVVDRKVNNFNFTREQQKDLQQKVEEELNSLVNKADKEMNKPQKGLGGKLKKLAFNAFVDMDEIHEQVPAFASTIVSKINSPASRKRLKKIANIKIDQLENETFDDTQVARATVTGQIYRKYKVNNAAAFDNAINAKLASVSSSTSQYTFAMLGCVALALLLWLFFRKQTKFHTPLFILSLLFAFVLLIVGITSTIIEVDARIQSLNFTLLGEKLAFRNQVLFFQSKSITGIIKELLTQPKPDAVLVGVLLLLFVVILPVLRMIGKGIHIWGRNSYAQNKVIRYLAFDLGKWDMADVMVVGIAMTYIGLNGILQSQLSNLNIHEELLSTVTQNNTSLQAGFYIFVSYVVYSYLLSTILKRITHD